MTGYSIASLRFLRGVVVTLWVGLALVANGPAWGQTSDADAADLLKAGGILALTQDLKMAVGGALIYMRGIDNAEGHAWPVITSQSARAALVDPIGGIENFALRSMSLMRYEEVPGKPGLMAADVVAVLADPFKRRMAVTLNLEYFISGARLTIYQARVSPYVNEAGPDFRYYVVPAGALDEAFLAANPDANTFLSRVVEAAVEPAAANHALSSGGEHFIVALSLDRLPPGDDIAMIAGERADDLVGNADGSVTLNFSGWPVAVMPTRLTGTAPVHFKVLHRSAVGGQGAYVAASVPFGG